MDFDEEKKLEGSSDLARPAFVYILECADGTLYTGWTFQVEKRLVKHNSGKGARYTRARRPVILAYSEQLKDEKTARKREYELKRLARPAKLALLTGQKGKLMAETESENYPFKPLDFKRKDFPHQLAASRRFLEMISQRRTVREYSKDPVPFELIEIAIRAAGTAPSGANLQPWTFVVVENPEIKHRIRLAAEEEEKEFYEKKITPEWRAALAPLGTDWVKTHLDDAPYLIIVFEQAYGLVKNNDGQPKKMKHYYAQESVGIAVGFLLASLTSAGLVTLTHTPSPMGFLSKLLNRPANERAFVIIPVGYPADNARVPAISKKSLEDIMVRV